MHEHMLAFYRRPIISIRAAFDKGRPTHERKSPMLNPFINLINNIIFLINLALIVWIVIGLLLHFDIVNRNSPLVQRVYEALTRICDPLLRPIRKVTRKLIPGLTDIDVSPIILILLLNFINNALYDWFYRI